MNAPLLVSAESSLDDKHFKNFVLVSLAVHASLLLFIGIKNIFSSEENLILSQSIRVDVVALPDKTVDLPTPQAEPASVESPKKPEPVKIMKQTQKDVQQKAIEKMKAMSAIEKLKQQVADEQRKANAAEKVKPPLYKGQIISSGNNFQGMSRLRVNEYLENLTSTVRDHWELPQWLSDANLKAVVVVSIDGRGVVVKNEIHTPSGNTVFDASCVAAVQRSAPLLTAPPAEVREALLLIRFPFE